jgi:Homeodomain-like domain-containing protein
MRRRTTAQTLALRTRVVLARVEIEDNRKLAERLGITRQTVGRWRQRFIGSGLCYIGHVLMENRNELCTDALVSQAHGRAEPGSAMVRRSVDASRRRATLG